MADVMAVPAIEEEVWGLGFEARFDDAEEGDDWDGNGTDPDWEEEDDDEWEDEDEEDEWEEDDDWDEDDDEWEDDADESDD